MDSLRARACRNSLLWYNDMHEHELNAKLGLVGIPCYGTMNAKRVRRATRLGLVGIPCYGTIQADNEPALQLARACRNSLLWYNAAAGLNFC